MVCKIISPGLTIRSRKIYMKKETIMLKNNFIRKEKRRQSDINLFARTQQLR